MSHDQKIFVLLLRPADEPPPRRPSDRLVLSHIPLLDWKPLQDNLSRLEDLLDWADWLVYTSFRGVRATASLAERIRAARGRGLRVAAVGPRTAEEVRSVLGFEPDLVPGEYRGARLAEELVGRGARRVLMARSDKALEEPVKLLRRHGVEVADVPVYTMVVLERMVEAAVRAAPLHDYVVFTSPSIVKAFFSKWRGGGIRAAAIGPTTARALREQGVEPVVTPRVYTLEAVLEAILEKPPI